MNVLTIAMKTYKFLQVLLPYIIILNLILYVDYKEMILLLTKCAKFSNIVAPEQAFL